MERTLGKRISACRKKLGLTQDQLAEQLGLTAQAVSKWENDLSCPDITILPKLADIFHVTTDELLGHEGKVRKTAVTVVNTPQDEKPNFEFDSNTGKVEFHWDGGKLGGLALACWVLLTGAVYLAAQLLYINITFWNVLWPSFLLIFGLFGLFSKFSVVRIGCALIGAYFLADKLHLLDLHLNKGILFAILVLLFGISLLAEALRRKKRKKDYVRYIDRKGKMHHGNFCNDYQVEGNCFTFDASFGESFQQVEMETLLNGHISTNFGDYTVDLSGVGSLENNCRLQADCSFGELTILVPRHFTVVSSSSTSFAGFEIQGQPDPVPQGILNLNGDVSFGNILIQYK